MTSDAQQREQAAMEAVTERLVNDFASDRDAAEVSEAINSAYHDYDQAPIRDFVPIFVERHARQKLARTS